MEAQLANTSFNLPAMLQIENITLTDGDNEELHLLDDVKTLLIIEVGMFTYK